MKVAVIYNKETIKESDVINLFGTPTRERYQPKTIEMVASALESGGHNVRTIEGNMHVIDELQNFMPRVVKGERTGMVFNMAYGIQGQSRYTHIPAMLEMLGIPYIGSSPAVHAVALDKVMSKIVFLRHNLPTPAYWVFSSPDEDLTNIHYPVVVKPKMEAVSLGLHVVHNKRDLQEAIAFIVEEFHQQALVEEFISGREFAVLLLGNGSTLQTLPIIEIDLDGDTNAIQSLDDKMQHPRPKICPADISSDVAWKLCELSKRVFNALGAFDFGRVDFRQSTNGQLHILELNSMASLNPSGSFVHSASVGGLDFTALVNRILDISAIRYFGESYRKSLGTGVKTKKSTEPLHHRVRSYSRSHLTQIVENIEQMVSMNSYVHNIDGVNTLGNWISKNFKQLNFQKQIFPQVKVGNILYFSNHTESDNDVLLLGNLDTVYDYRNLIPFREERGIIYGSGAAESKGGIAVILAALHALRFARELKHVNCGVLFTTDDRLGGRFSKKHIAEFGQKSKFIVGTKYGDVNGGIVTTCSGAQQFQIEIINIKNGKNKRIFNVAQSISKKCLAWQKLASPEQGIDIIINSLSVQSNPGKSSDHATAKLTVRFNDKKQGDELAEQIRAIAEKDANGGLEVRVRAGQRRLPVVETTPNRKFFKEVQSISKSLEIHVEPTHREATSDICHVPENIPVLDGFGPIGGDSRSPNEFIIRDSLIDRATLLAMVINSCAEGK